MRKAKKREQHTKFSPCTIAVKARLRELRLNAGYSMNKGAAKIGLTRKMLEDLETVRNYGSHIELEILAKISIVYSVSVSELVGQLPRSAEALYFVRPHRGS